MAGVDKGVPDPALARVWIQPIVTGVEVGDPDLAYIVVDRCQGRGTRSGSG